MNEDDPVSPEKDELKVVELENVAIMTDKEIEAYSKILWQKLTKEK